jgi:hypothetical protein
MLKRDERNAEEGLFEQPAAYFLKRVTDCRYSRCKPAVNSSRAFYLVDFSVLLK